MFFKKIIMLLCTIIACSFINYGVAEQLVGGFGAPQFFKKYDKKAVDKIAKTPKITCVQVSYPSQLKSLAYKIKNEIIKQSLVKVQLKEVNLVDTTTTKYIHDSVVVVVYYNSCPPEDGNGNR